MVTRRGHSLVELIVALVLLATAFGAVGASAVLGAHRTALGASRQEALAAAEAALDSLLAVAAPRTGAGSVGGVRVRWTVVPPDAPAGRVTVEAFPAAGGAPVVLSGPFFPPGMPPVVEASP